MTFAEFQKLGHLSRQDIYLETFRQNRKSIRIKNEMTAVKNLGLIFDATLRISNNKGFQAMTMRDLSRETGLSMGALYSYFSSKKELLEMLQRQGRNVIRQILEEQINVEKDPSTRLRAAIQTHIYLSEIMHPWFYFSYMEAKNLKNGEGQKAIASELYTEKLLADILKQGKDEGVFFMPDHQLTASIIKAMLQDWYLKRWKYAKRKVSVEKYTRLVLAFVEAFCLKKSLP